MENKLIIEVNPDDQAASGYTLAQLFDFLQWYKSPQKDFEEKSYDMGKWSEYVCMLPDGERMLLGSIQRSPALGDYGEFGSYILNSIELRLSPGMY